MKSRTFWARIAIALVSTGCTMQSGGSGNPGGGGVGGSGTGGAGTSGSGGASGAPMGTFSCLGILSCVQKNNCADDACVNNCMNQGSPDAKNAVVVLATCYKDNGCQDSTCLQQACGSELKACVGQSAPPATGIPTDPGSNVPAGSVPAWLVGEWTFLDGFDPGSEEDWVFNADGTATYSKGYAGGIAGCNNTQLLQYSGNAVVDDTTITLYANDATTKTDTCGAFTNQSAQPAKITYSYSVDAEGHLKTVDETCAAQYVGYDTSIGLYCTSTFTKH